MKRLLSIMLMAVCSIIAMAQGNHWTYNSNTYPDATVVYAKVNDGSASVGNRYEIAAFVGGELRAVTRSYRTAGTTTRQNIYTLRVEGDNTTDRNKAITFRLYDHETGLEYTLAETATYNGETVVAPSSARSLTLNAVDFIEWEVGTTGELWIPKGDTVRLPYTLHSASGAPIDEATVTPFTISGITVSGNTGNYFTLSADGKSVTGNSVTPATPGTIRVNSTVTYTVNVYQAIEQVVATTSRIVLKVGEEQLISQYYEILPAGCTLYDVTATTTSDDPSYIAASITEDGSGRLMIKGNIAGTGTLQVTVSNMRDPNRPFVVDIPYEVCERLQGIRIVNTAGEDLSNTGTQMVMGGTATVKVQAVPESCDIVADNLTATITGEDYAAGWTYVNAVRSGLEYTLAGRALTLGHYLNIAYTEDGETFTASIPVKVGQHITLEEGWNWSQPFSKGVASGDYTVATLIGNSVVDMRTETGLLYNDPEWGLFGDIDDVLAPSRIKVSDDVAYDYFCQPYNGATGAAPLSADLNLHARWNWIDYPYMYAHRLSDIYTATCGASEGDVIKTQTGFSTYEGGAWTNDLQLYPGESMAYYNASDASKMVSRPLFSELSQPAAGAGAPRRMRAASSPWEYNPRQFMDNMGMVAVLDFVEDGILDHGGLGDGIEDGNLGNWTIGAFVGDECRGEGVLNNGRWFITVHGEAGDVVTLKLMDASTGMVYELDGRYEFAAMMGSVKEPVRVAVTGVATGIVDLDGEIVEDGILDHGRLGGVFTLDGKQIRGREVHPGVYIVNGKKRVIR